jgi:hypothetical protein
VALFAGLRGAGELADPPLALSLTLAAVAAAASALSMSGLPGSGVRWTDRIAGVPHTSAVVLALAALAAAAAPVPAARTAGGLLAAAAVLAAADLCRSWPLLAAFPGAAVVATGLADVPVPDGPHPVVHVALAALLAVAAAGLAAAPVRPAESGPSPAPEVQALVVVLVGWLALAPGSWRWAVPDDDVLGPWDRAAATAAAVAVVVVALLSAPALDRFRRVPRR